jgi:hypothetical protein
MIHIVLWPLQIFSTSDGLTLAGSGALGAGRQ